MEMSGQLHALSALQPGKGFTYRYPLDRRFIGPPSRSRRGDEKNRFPSRDSNPGLLACSLVTILTELPSQQFGLVVVKRNDLIRKPP
jgi:hypothetical protein